MTMWLRQPAPDICGMPLTPAPASQLPDAPFALRVRHGDDAVELQRRLEACLLIVRRVAPVLSPVA